jgi:hypothetical protein
MKSFAFFLLFFNLSCKPKQINPISKTEVSSYISDTNNIGGLDKKMEPEKNNEEFELFLEKFLLAISKQDVKSFLELSYKKIIYNGDITMKEVFVQNFFQIAFDERMKTMASDKANIVVSRIEEEGAYEPRVIDQIRNPRGNFYIYEVYINLGVINQNVQGKIKIDFVETGKGYMFIEYSRIKLHSTPDLR